MIGIIYWLERNARIVFDIIRAVSGFVIARITILCMVLHYMDDAYRST